MFSINFLKYDEQTFVVSSLKHIILLEDIAKENFLNYNTDQYYPQFQHTKGEKKGLLGSRGEGGSYIVSSCVPELSDIK